MQRTAPTNPAVINDPEKLDDDYFEEDSSGPGFRHRLQLVLGAAVVALCAFSAGDLTLQGPRYPVLFILQLTQIAVILVVVRILRTAHSDRGIMAIGVGAFTVIYLTVASIGAISGESSTTALLFCALALTSAATLPWGLRPQLATVSVAGVALLAVVYSMSGDTLPQGYRSGNILVIGALLLGSVLVAHQLQQYRERTGKEHRLLLAAQERFRRYDSEIEDRVALRTAALEKTNQELEGFSYTVSHDLRSPLRIMSGFTQILLEDYGDMLDEAGVQHVHRVRAATHHMGKIIDGLLELAGLAKSEFQVEPVDLSALVTAETQELQTAYPEHPVEVVVEPGITASASATLIELALSNLLENAWKYTRGVENPRVEFGQTELGGRAAYYLTDNGVGFDSEAAKDLFIPFRRLHHKEEFEGSGIGLATVERIVERHGGAVWAKSHPGEGATFYFSL